MNDKQHSENMRDFFQGPRHVDGSADYLSRIELILDESYKMHLKAAINAEQICKDQQDYFQSNRALLLEIRDLLKSLSWTVAAVGGIAIAAYWKLHG